MKTLLVAAIAMAAGALLAPGAFAGNTSSNSSSNTSSDSGSRGSSYRHSHDWSLDSDDGRGRRILRGGTNRIERYSPNFQRFDRPRRYRVERDDD